jgi:hypothetical protein
LDDSSESEDFCKLESRNEVASTYKSSRDDKLIECDLNPDSVAKLYCEKSQFFENEILNVISNEESNYYDVHKAGKLQSSYQTF